MVYFSTEGECYTRDQVRAMGYEKTANPADLVCHCFDVTAVRVMDEYRSGDRLSNDFIVEQTRQQRCACEARNPSGRCCLKGIRDIEKGMDVDPVIAGLHRLKGILPLAARLAEASPLARQAYARITARLRRTGRPVGAPDLKGVDEASFGRAIGELADADLIVPDIKHTHVLGAYPLTTESTDHHLDVDGVRLFAMCALDALAVAPVTGSKVCIDSRCVVSSQKVRVRQEGDTLVVVEPKELQVGIAWQDTDGCAAHSLCRDMVFLANPQIAAEWREAGTGMRDTYSLNEAVTLARTFFEPLAI